jgi:hypothetical protein
VTASRLAARYVAERRTAEQLGRDVGRSGRWVRDAMAAVPEAAPAPTPGPAVIVADVTFFDRRRGVLVCRDPNRRENPHWHEVPSETSAEYASARDALLAAGVDIKAVVTDGRRGVREVFAGVPAQMCHFHQIKTVTTYLTRRPKTEAARELRALALTLTRAEEAGFSAALAAWNGRWSDYLKERTADAGAGRWQYTHRRLRAAYRSLKSNLPFLFTFQRLPELNIPNTTNSLDGSFAAMKNLLSAHKGMSGRRRSVLVSQILSKKSLQIFH